MCVCVCVCGGGVFTRLTVELIGSGQGMDHFFTTTCVRDENIQHGKEKGGERENNSPLQ